MASKLKKPNLKERTEEYWEYHRGDHDCYIDELLGRELSYAQKPPPAVGTDRLRRLDKPVHTLALTVGESFEPLLQVTCVLRPKRVVLILNKAYSGTPGIDHGETLKDLMKNLVRVSDLPVDMRSSLSDTDFDLIELKVDTPTHVFRALRDAIQNPAALPPEGYVNAVDITGAKKSMVVGAFLYAAHSGLPITYVDFDEYNSDWGRPYGYTCKIGQISDPYEAFRLREWEQVRRLYNSYNFRGARILLGKARSENELGSGILGAMSDVLDRFEHGNSLYEANDIEKTERLVQAMEMYESWDSGDFQSAIQLANTLPKEIVPSSAMILGGGWSVISEPNTATWSTDIYTDCKKLSAYAFDELKRIGRLIQHHQDFRSAFLRSGGLSEVLMTARVVALIEDSAVRRDFLTALTQRTPTAEKTFKALRNPPGASFALDELGLRKSPKATVTVAEPMQSWWDETTFFKGETGWERFLDLRNVLTHRYVAVSEELARDALCFVTANLEDCTGQSLDSLSLNAQAADWAELCRLLRLDFLPPKLLT